MFRWALSLPLGTKEYGSRKRKLSQVQGNVQPYSYGSLSFSCWPRRAVLTSAASEPSGAVANLRFGTALFRGRAGACFCHDYAHPGLTPLRAGLFRLRQLDGSFEAYLQYHHQPTHTTKSCGSVTDLIVARNDIVWGRLNESARQCV
jgi:hypothetical protein